MKKRFGFVSNSSSSSFLIYGISIGGSTMLKIFNAINKAEESDEYHVAELMAREMDIEMHCPPEGDYYFGECPSSIKDDQTGAEFKKTVRNKMLKYFPDSSNFSYYEDAWYEG